MWQAYDANARSFIEPKSRAGKRKVPIAAVLRDYLVEHTMLTGRSEGLIFGATSEKPFTASNAANRAKRAWASVDAVQCGGTTKAGKPCRVMGRRGKRYCGHHKHLEESADVPLPQTPVPIGFHEARHTFASLMIDAGVNVKALSTLMGHSSVAITLDPYGHLMPGGEDEAAARLDAYLERANIKARLARIGRSETDRLIDELLAVSASEHLAE